MPKAKAIGDNVNFAFLISCIRHSQNGKIDFEKVAEECDVVTKGAAAKRYERLMKAHGIHQPTGPTGRDTGVQPLKPKAKAQPKQKTGDDGPPNKKRKRSQSKKAKSPSPDEDEEDEASIAVKGEPSDEHNSDENGEEYEDVDGDFEVEPIPVKKEVSA